MTFNNQPQFEILFHVQETGQPGLQKLSFLFAGTYCMERLWVNNFGLKVDS